MKERSLSDILQTNLVVKIQIRHFTFFLFQVN